MCRRTLERLDRSRIQNGHGHRGRSEDDVRPGVRPGIPSGSRLPTRDTGPKNIGISLRCRLKSLMHCIYLSNHVGAVFHL